jgi:hypothetical protein
MQTNMIPFNLDLLVLTNDQAKLLGQVKVLDTFVASSKNFHPEGLFSTEIFGRVGDSSRNYRFGYIDLHMPLFHPVVFDVLSKLKGLYADIILSKGFAVWNDEIKDFEKSTPIDGKTGITFFIKHYKELKLEGTGSDRRDFFIKLIEKYKDKSLLTKLLVMPAGIRDYEFDEYGKPSKDEINDYYARIIALSNLLSNIKETDQTEAFDTIRANMQTALSTLYDYIKTLLEGKHKLILGKWGSRRIANGTRNVITTVNNQTDELGSALTAGYNDTIVGLYQFLKGTLPMAVYAVRSGLLSKVFQGPNAPAFLVDQKTKKKAIVNITADIFDRWMTDEGIETLINTFAEEETRHLPITVNDHYLALIYQDDKEVYVLQDIQDLPQELNRELVHPITMTEFFYFAALSYVKKVSGFFTRYPITGYGSIYPCKMFLKTTIPSKNLILKNPEFLYNEDGLEHLTQYPIVGADFMNSMSPAHAHLARLGADFDGDTCSLNIVYTEEAVNEINQLLSKAKYYVDANKKMNFSASNDALNYTLAMMTGS